MIISLDCRTRLTNRTAPLSQKESELGGQSSAPGDDLQFPRRSFSTDPDMDSPTVPQEAISFT